VLLLVFAWLLPNSFYAVYMQIARIVSAFFLLLQLVILIDFAYQWNTDWTSEEKGWQKGVLAVSFLLYAASLTIFVLDLVYFGQGPSSCHTQKFFIAFTLVLTFIMTGISVSNVLKDGGGLLPAGVVTLYSYWLLFNALTSDPSECNTVSSRSRELIPLIIGLLLTTASITYASWSVATNTALFENEAPLNRSAGVAAPSSGPESADVEKAAIKSDDDDDHEEPVDVSVHACACARQSKPAHRGWD
jgi:hypothetical protein